MQLFLLKSYDFSFTFRTKQQFRHLCRISNKVCWCHWETETLRGEMSRRATGPDKLYRCCSGKKIKIKLFSDPGVNSWLWRQTPLFQSLHCFSWSHAFITVKVSLTAMVRGGTQDLVPPFRQWFFTLSGADWGCLLFKRRAERSECNYRLSFRTLWQVLTVSPWNYFQLFEWAISFMVLNSHLSIHTLSPTRIEVRWVSILAEKIKE